MLKRKNEFKQVSYFSKAPLHVHFSLLLITLFVLATVAAYVFNVFSNSSLVQFLTLLLFFIASLFVMKQWKVTRKKYNASPFKKLMRFIRANKLYEEETREVNSDNKNSKMKR